MIKTRQNNSNKCRQYNSTIDFTLKDSPIEFDDSPQTNSSQGNPLEMDESPSQEVRAGEISRVT